METVYLNPTAEQTYEIICHNRPELNFEATLARALNFQINNDIEQACNTRFEAVQLLQTLLPEDEVIALEWNHRNSQAAIEIVYASAIDHFLISDWEMSSALLELQLDLDPEDHMEATNILAYNYLALGEYELFDEIINDISDKYPARTILLLCSAFLRDGAISQRELGAFRSRLRPEYEEFTADEHPYDEAYLTDIESERPSRAAKARELWLQTENLWRTMPEFIEALKG